MSPSFKPALAAAMSGRTWRMTSPLCAAWGPVSSKAMPMADFNFDEPCRSGDWAAARGSPNSRPVKTRPVALYLDTGNLLLCRAGGRRQPAPQPASPHNLPVEQEPRRLRPRPAGRSPLGKDGHVAGAVCAAPALDLHPAPAAVLLQLWGQVFNLPGIGQVENLSPRGCLPTPGNNGLFDPRPPACAALG
jgi:hypothetical protein